MLEVKIQELTKDRFAAFGQYANLMEPSQADYSLQGEYHYFYRDMLRFPYHDSRPMGFSSLLVRKNEDFIIKNMEYHDTTDELQMVLDYDAVLTVAPANGGELEPEKIQAFHIPIGTSLLLYAGTWHDVMYPLEDASTTILIGLPERLYKIDLTVAKLSEPIRLKK